MTLRTVTYNPLTHKIVHIEQRVVTQLSTVFVKEGSYSNCDCIHYSALCNDGTMWSKEHDSHTWQKIQNVPQYQESEQIPVAIGEVQHYAAQASKQEPVQFLYDMTPPPEFLEYIRKNYSGEVNFHDPDWHAMRLWNAAMKNFKPPYIDFPFKDKAKQEHIESNQEAYSDLLQQSKDKFELKFCGNSIEADWIYSDLLDKFSLLNQPKSIEPAQDNEGWITFNDGGRPVSHHCFVDVILSDGSVKYKTMAGVFGWRWVDGCLNIIKYRIAKESK